MPKAPKDSIKFWKFNPINKGESEEAELILYGDIASVESWYSDTVTPLAFSNELKELGDVDTITVRINSDGGEIFAANAIYTRLRDHKAKIVVKIDGWAGSAATIIAMAADPGELLIPANAVFMIHDPAAGFFGYYGKEEIEKRLDSLETCKKSIIRTYADRTGKTDEEIEELMAAETYWTGEEAVENGFCDKLMFTDLAVAVGGNQLAVINSVPFDMTKLTDKQRQKITNNQPALKDDFKYSNKKQITEKETKNMGANTITTMEDLMATHPELVAKIQDNAVNEERKRIQDIENTAPAGYEAIVSSAKFEKPVNAGEVAVQILQHQKAQGENYIGDRNTDVDDSGMGKVTSGAQEGMKSKGDPDLDGEKGQKAINKIFDEIDADEGGKKA